MTVSYMSRLTRPAMTVLALLVSSVFVFPTHAQVSVLTQAYNNSRTGANLSETTLTPSNVSVSTFGLLFTRQLDNDVNGQVLYVPNLTINSAVHNVIIAYTSGDYNGSSCSLYAFDADNPTESAPLWHHTFTNAAEWTTSTPVIDDVADIVYVVTKDNDDSGATHLHAIDLLTGTEMTGSPVTIAASLPGTGDGNVSGVVSFDSGQANCRPGLLLLNGVVYLAFAHNSDSYPYHGWVFGYQYTGSGFTRTSFFCTDPNGGLSGIWMAGMGLAADSSGNIYLTTGNGTFDVNTGGDDYGMSILKLATPDLSVEDYFTPFDELGNSNEDLDLGSVGILAIPGTNRLFTGAGKSGSGFLVDTSELGRFTPNGPDSVVQRLNGISSNNNVGQNPVCFDAGSVKYVYLWPGGEDIRQFLYDPTAGQFNPAGIDLKSSHSGGGSLTVSANGSTDGILWAAGNNDVLYALDATNITKADLWNSNMDASRDGLGSPQEFEFPTVANGKVYVPGSGQIYVYGLLSPPKLTSITVSPGPTLTLTAPAEQQFTATAYDQYGGAMSPQPTFGWSLAAGAVGSITTAGLYHSGVVAGSATVRARSGSVSGSTAVTVNPVPVTVATAATATPSPVTATTTKLSVLGGYAGTGGAGVLTYTWSSTGPATVTYAANGTNAARDTTATFTRAGSYNLKATINGPNSQSTSSSVNVTVNQTITSIVVSPGPTLTISTPLPKTQQFTAAAHDQFGNAMSPQPSFVWSVTAGGVGSITVAGGLYHSGTVAGSATVKAKSGGVSGQCVVTVN